MWSFVLNSGNLPHRHLKCFSRFNAMSQTHCFEWHSHFRNCQTLLEDVHAPAQLLKISTKFGSLVDWTTIHNVDAVGISFGMVQVVITGLVMHHIPLKSCHIFNYDVYFTICKDQQVSEDLTLISKIITGRNKNWFTAITQKPSSHPNRRASKTHEMTRQKCNKLIVFSSSTVLCTGGLFFHIRQRSFKAAEWGHWS